MVKSSSIRQFNRPDALPDFRNLGVIARILLATNAVAAATALVRAARIEDFTTQFLDLALWVEPALFGALAALYAVGSLLSRLPYAAGAGSVIAVVVAVCAVLGAVQARLVQPAGSGTPWIGVVSAALLAAALLEYFRLRSRAFSPALAEARLQALQARIRPHFLFNSLNAVLSMIRTDPKQAEGALEDLADLFRNLLADNRQLIPLRDEIRLCRQYLNLEKLRLSERLDVRWSVDPKAEDALVPPMLLQPLVENAVYHGIEPGLGRGTIEIGIGLEGERIRVRLGNPYHPEHQHRQGNRMALANIRERLELHFDLEAELHAADEGDRYHIDMVMPFRRTA